MNHPPVLSEFTLELETRPMVAFDPELLDRLQEAADARREQLLDPVFALDESKGSILAVFQVWAATAALAAALGVWLFTTTMVRAGLTVSRDAIELVAVNKVNENKPLAVKAAMMRKERDSNLTT